MSHFDLARLLSSWCRPGCVAWWLGGSASALLAIGCDSAADTVCESVADCERGGDSEWLTACQDEAKTLAKEASSLGCTSQFDDYYSCANDKFRCDGATAKFPTCEDERAALDDCFAQAQGKTACSELAATTSACSSSSPGAGGAESETPAPACTPTRDCDARCYLDNVSSACAPNAAELSTVSNCSAACPP